MQGICKIVPIVLDKKIDCFHVPNDDGTLRYAAVGHMAHICLTFRYRVCVMISSLGAVWSGSTLFP